MLAFGCAIHSEEKYRHCAARGIELVSSPDTRVIELRGQTSIFSAYNEILDRAKRDRGIEAVVLLHEDTEIRDRGFVRKVRRALSQPDVAIVGTVGTVGVTGIDWWNAERGLGIWVHEVYPPDERLSGEAEVSGFIKPGELMGPGGTGDADMVDGFLMVFSRWAIRELRFDEDLAPGFHGYDADICFQARERGKRVFVVMSEAAHHRNWHADPRQDGPGSDPTWRRAHAAFRRKWEDRWPLPAPPWANRLESEPANTP